MWHFILQEFNFADREQSTKIKTRKFSCYMYGGSPLLSCLVIYIYTHCLAHSINDKCITHSDHLFLYLLFSILPWIPQTISCACTGPAPLQGVAGGPIFDAAASGNLGAPWGILLPKILKLKSSEMARNAFKTNMVW